MGTNSANSAFFENALHIRSARKGAERSNKHGENEQLIISLTDVDNGLPVYCVPSISLLPSDFRVLSWHLRHQRLYSFNAPPDSEADTPTYTSSVHSIAEHYAEAISNFQSDGPLAMAGTSAGVIIALETAQELKRLGRDVKLLAAFDFGPVAPETCTHRKFGHRVIGSYYRLRRRAKVRHDFFRRVSEEIYRHPNPKAFIRAVQKKLAKKREAIEEQQRRQARVIKNDLPRGIDLSNFSPARQELIVRLYHNCQVHKAAPYDGPVVAYVATEQPGRHENKVAALWKCIARDLEIAVIKGGHLTILESPQLAQHLRQRLAGLEIGRPSIANL